MFSRLENVCYCVETGGWPSKFPRYDSDGNLMDSRPGTPVLPIYARSNSEYFVGGTGQSDPALVSYMSTCWSYLDKMLFFFVWFFF